MRQLPKVLFVVPPVRLHQEEFDYLLHFPRHAIVLAAELGEAYDARILDVAAEFLASAAIAGNNSQDPDPATADVLDFPFAAALHDLILQRIVDFAPDIVAVHAHAGPHLPIVKRTLEAITEALPQRSGMQVVLGGMAATHLAEELAAWSPEETWIIRGEATGRIRDLFALVLGQRECDPTLESLQRMPAGRIRSEPSRVAAALPQPGMDGSAPAMVRVVDILRNPPIMDYPRPRFELLPMATYQLLFQAGGFVPHLELGSGCTYGCKFCGVHYPGAERRFRRRPAARVLEELTHLRDVYGFDAFYFCDETFTLDRKHALELCHRMKGDLPGIRWRCVTRVDKIDDELARAMCEAGCSEVGFGVEVGSDEILAANAKEATADLNVQAIQRVQGLGMDANALTIIGMPQEDHADIRRTFEFLAREAKPNRCQIFVFHPVPGTEYFRFPERYGLRFDTRDVEEWYKWDHIGQPVCETRFLSCEDIARYFVLFNRAFATAISREADIPLQERILNHRFPVRRKGVTWLRAGRTLYIYKVTDVSKNIANNTLAIEGSPAVPGEDKGGEFAYTVEFILSRCNGLATREEISREVQALSGDPPAVARQRTGEVLDWLQELELVTEF